MTRNRFFIHLALIAIFFLAVLMITLQWLKSYTNHGQKLELPNYIGESISSAKDDADNKTFMIIVSDSIHKVGQTGGIILNQNPKGGSIVKENRKIYVTVSKYQADVVSSEHLTSKLYGGEFNMVKNRLENLEFKTEIKGYRYDRSDPNHILEVWYEGKNITDKEGIQIKKGSTISFILSKSDDGEVSIPDLKCQTVDAASVILDYSRLSIGTIQNVGEITNEGEAYIISQNPDPKSTGVIKMGSSIDIRISQEKPKDCN